MVLLIRDGAPKKPSPDFLLDAALLLSSLSSRVLAVPEMPIFSQVSDIFTTYFKKAHVTPILRTLPFLRSDIVLSLFAFSATSFEHAMISPPTLYLAASRFYLIRIVSYSTAHDEVSTSLTECRRLYRQISHDTE